MGETMFPPFAPFFLALQLGSRLASRPAEPGSGRKPMIDPERSRAPASQDESVLDEPDSP